MGLRLTLIILVGVIFAADNKAYGEEMPLWDTVNGWDVRVDTTLGASCFVLQVYDGGTALRLGFNKLDGNAYIMLGDDHWNSLEEGKTYDLELQLDNEGVWDAPASVTEIGTANFLYIMFSDVDLLNEIAERHVFEARFRGKSIARLSLKGSYAAVQEMIQCQRLVDEAAKNADPFSGGDKEDPFAEQDNNYSGDPFAM